MFGLTVLAAGLFELFWVAVRVVFWFGTLLLVAVVRAGCWTVDWIRDDPADHPEWWAARLAERPEGGWL
jgi:hypothetical protein